MAWGYTVYKVDYRTKEKEAVGCIMDRRGRERGDIRNLLDLLAEARRLFARGPGDVISIVLDSPRDAVMLREKAVSRGILTITSGPATRERRESPRGGATMSRGNRGQAVMLAVMGAMLVAGLLIWLGGGEFHMMPGHGKKDSHAESRPAPAAPHDPGHGVSPRPEGASEAAAARDSAQGGSPRAEADPAPAGHVSGEADHPADGNPQRNSP